MAEDAEDQVENALNLVVCTVEQSSNMRKTLKQKIFDTVSTLRTLFVKLKDSGNRKTSEIHNLKKQLDEMGTEIKMCRDKLAKAHRAPSFGEATEQEENVEKRQGMPSTAISSEPFGEPTRYEALSKGNMRKNYAEAVKGVKNKTHKITVKSTGAHPPDTIKQILRTKINPGEIKVGIRTFKSFSGGVIIETNSKEEIEILSKEIQEKCGRDLEAHIHSLRKPRLIILNVPEEISTTNIEDSILRQNPELNLKEGSIAAKFIYVTKKKHRNAVVEVSAETRRTLLNKKIRIGWQICRIDDYITATRCYKCSKFNHRTQDCRGEVTCPLCAGNHTLKECKGDSTMFKCINCENYKKHNPTSNISAAHSALDRKCPSLQAILQKNRQNTEY